jgi:L-lactate permease
VVAILALLPPWVLIYLVSGWEGVSEAWPLAIVGSLSYILGQWPVAHFLGPYLPDLSGALVSFWVLFIFVKMWRRKRFADSAASRWRSRPLRMRMLGKWAACGKLLIPGCPSSC